MSKRKFSAANGYAGKFLDLQKFRLLSLRDELLDSIAGITKDSLRVGPEGSEASAGGMHMADAGSDTYDRGFALSTLSRGQDALYEIDDALSRLAKGVYGICEISGNAIPENRLAAIPFARYTVQEQGRREKEFLGRGVVPTVSLFGLDDAESDEDESGAN